MQYFQSLTQSNLIGIIDNTKKELFLCMPSIHKEIADSISELSYKKNADNEKIKIHLLLDFDAQTFRQGYGNIDSVEELVTKSYDVRTLKDNRISFIISDNIGFYLFIESRSLIPADKKTINAVKIDPASIVRLKHFFFPNSVSGDFKDELQNAVIDEFEKLRKDETRLLNQIAPVSEISKEQLKTVTEDLNNNPPLNPDYKRIVEIYSNKFQYVKLEFEGSNIQNHKIFLPKDALPVADAELKNRLETKLNLFSKDNINKIFIDLQKLKDNVSLIREGFLTKVKGRDESLLNRQHKVKFDLTIDSLRNKIIDVTKKTLLKIDEEIDNTKNNLFTELYDYYVQNPKSLFEKTYENYLDNPEYIKRAALKKTNKILNELHWPEAHKLLEKLNINVQYSDITYEDLKNEKFIHELKEIGLINESDVNQLAEFRKGIETK